MKLVNRVKIDHLACLKTSLLLYVLLFLLNSEKNNAKTSILSYKVNTTVKSRFAQTHVSVDFVNTRNCTMLYGFEMKIPQNARVTNLYMTLSNECKLNSEVKEEEKAQIQFDTSLSQGNPAAILKAWNSTIYPVQVSIPPFGNTVLDIFL